MICILYLQEGEEKVESSQEEGELASEEPEEEVVEDSKDSTR